MNERTSLFAVALVLCAATSCGSNDAPSASDSGAGGALASGGTSGTGGSGAATGTQPLGAICANDGNCSQTTGAAVCCQSTCTLSDQCPTSSTYLACNSAADCAAYGGKVCCEATAGGQTMRFCTKPSACSGTVLP